MHRITKITDNVRKYPNFCIKFCDKKLTFLVERKKSEFAISQGSKSARDTFALIHSTHT